MIISICLCMLCACTMMCFLLMMKQAKRLRVVSHSCTARGERHTFALLSDIHLDACNVPWGEIITAIQDSDAEFVVLTGDLCNHLQTTGKAGSFVDLLASRLQRPIYITFGNHDNKIFRTSPALRDAYRRELEALSPFVRVLEQEYLLHEDLLIGGLGDVQTNTADITKIVSEWGEIAQKRGASFLLATHNADLLLKLSHVPEERKPHLTVCGHTHAGQIRLPFRMEFTVFRKDVLAKKGYSYGMCRYDGFPLYITSGIGCSFAPIRFGSCAEVAILSIGGEG